MAGRKNKYETHVKPYFKDIKEALERGVEEKTIADGLGVSVSAWCNYKKQYKEFAELFQAVDVSDILRRLDSALMKCAEGFYYEEKKQYITEDEDGNGNKNKNKKKHTEILSKYQPPNVTAIFGAYNRYDPNYIKDKAYYELKKQELELRKEMAENKDW